MSNKDNNNPLPDYLDVSSEEEPIKNANNNPIKEDNSYHSFKIKEKYYDNSDDKYYHKNRRYKSRSRHKFYNKSRSRSRSFHHRNKKHHNHKRSDSNSSSYRKVRNLKYSKSSSRDSYYKDRDKYRYSKHRDNYIRKNSDISCSSSYNKDKYRKSHGSKRSKSKNSNNSSHRKNIVKMKEEKKEFYNEKNKWTDGEKKLEFRQIKIEKYDKNKNKEINNKNKDNNNIFNKLNNKPTQSKEKQKEKEISKLKKDLAEKKDSKEIIIEKEKPNFEPSGILLKDLEFEYNKSKNNKILINYNPPSDSIIPTENDIWFLFKFIEDKKEPEETYKLINKEFFLIGKDPRICDIRIKQQNISRQHAVIQFRKIKKDYNWDILPYLIDLNSTNGTYLNGDKIDNKKYYELRDKDELNFGDKKIDFVLMKMK